MEDFFENTLVISWIAPIITGVIVVVLTSIIGRILTIWWKGRAFVRKRDGANEKYVNNILPYMIQELEINSQILYSIKSAIASEYQIAEKYLYSNEEIKNYIVLSISNTRFITEINKLKLINSVISFFDLIGEEKNIIEVDKDNKKRGIEKKYPLLSLISSLVFLAVIYIANPDKVDDPNSMVQILLFVGVMVLLASTLILWLSVMEGSARDINVELIDTGIIGMTMKVVQSIGETAFGILYGRKDKDLHRDDGNNGKDDIANRMS